MKQLEVQLQELEEKYRDQKCYSFNHIMELYLYQYYKRDYDFGLSEEPMNLWYMDLGNKFEKKENMEKAYEAYKKAIEWNPVDLDARFAKIELEKKFKRLEEVLKQTLELYSYLCSRATMARFYRNLGFYYTEKYQPQTANYLYEYSNLFFQTKNADSELEYIRKAMQKNNPQPNVYELQAKISELKIPVAAPSQTLGLLYEIGKSEEQKGNLQQAMDCYLLVYDLTQDEEIMERVKGISIF